MPKLRSILHPAALVVSASIGALILGTPAVATTPTPACTGPADRLDYPLRRVSQRLAKGELLTIVAIGSSSTQGAGASSSSASYPSRLEVELKERFPARQIRVLNRGVGGEEIADMLARFESGVLAEKPDLVLWQVGTNSVLRGHSIVNVAARVREGLERIRQVGADVILVDPQFAPKVLDRPDGERMVDLLGATAKTESVGVFHRFAVMRHWHKIQQMPFDTFLSPDGLHMNDWSYACVAKLLASAIEEASTRARAVAGTSATTIAPAAK
jgi:lysophospholipase L1-like esterase